jgi:hypothetical protein
VKGQIFRVRDRTEREKKKGSWFYAHPRHAGISVALYLTLSKLNNAQDVSMFFRLIVFSSNNFVGVNTPTCQEIDNYSLIILSEIHD